MSTQERPILFDLLPLSTDLQQVIAESKNVAREYYSPSVEPLHIFLTLLKLQEEQAIHPTIQLGQHINLDAMIKIAEQSIPTGNKPNHNISDQEKEIELSSRSRTAFTFASEGARNHGQNEIKTEDMLTGILREEQMGVTTILRMFGYI